MKVLPKYTICITASFFFLSILTDFERERESTLREVQRERKRERIPSRLCTDSREPEAGLELTNVKIMT